MIIWIVAVLLFAFLAWTGYHLGAVQALIWMIGLICATALTLTVGPLLTPLVPMVGITSLVLEWVLPYVTAFLLIVLVFAGLAYLAHWKVSRYYRNMADDLVRMRYERLNKKLGLSLGLMAGCVYVIALGVFIYAAGYVTVQTTGETAPVPLRVLNSAREGMAWTGLDKWAAQFDARSDRFYRTADVLGLLYHNPLLYGRLANYPALLSLGEKPQIQEVAKDTEFLQLLQNQEIITTIVDHPKTQAVIRDAEIREQLAQLDLPDLIEYLQTGKSPKYSEEPILGRWEVNLAPTLVELKRAVTNWPGLGWRALQATAAPLLNGTTILCTPEKQVYLKVESKQVPGIAAAAPPAPTPAPATGERGGAPTPGSIVSSIDADTADARRRMAARYGDRYGGGGPQSQTPALVRVQPAAAPPKAAVQNPMAKFATGQGSWQGTPESYTMRLPFDGREENARVTVRDGRMTIALGPVTLFCERQ